MISERQQEANRRNAAKSHGPKTPEGRAAVRHNALKHGFTAAEIIFPTVEEQIDFEQFRVAFEEEHQPVGPTEEVLVEDMVVSRWRLNRIRKMEPGFFAMSLQDLNRRVKEQYANLDAQAHLALIVRDDAQSSDTLGKMSRYEGRFERTFYKALKELQRLQALRAAVSDFTRSRPSTRTALLTAPSVSAGNGTRQTARCRPTTLSRTAHNPSVSAGDRQRQIRNPPRYPA